MSESGHEQVRSLGLDWDITRGTVTIFISKILKAQFRFSNAITSGLVTKTSGLSLLGSLRHIATCSQLPEPFTSEFMASRYLLTGTGDAASPVQLLMTYQTGCFNRAPVEEFTNVFNLSVHMHMYASRDYGWLFLRFINTSRSNGSSTIHCRFYIELNQRSRTSMCSSSGSYVGVHVSNRSTFSSSNTRIDNTSAVSRARRSSSRYHLPRSTIGFCH
ncbi:LOW QUALITY PROTEIN: hypothetical protein PHMEG_0006112 [Phytophthora megakarya]|uniref:Uncharacterized protein n=1 Tax=Phytophthora megakarya TaxID=4795 RepID=A0A225WRE0_9STRA|nr:LOW QUALITY PROTEIN: hypothetical protein PHMEG_0006112 [Phytophthora megakarya]